MVILHCGSIIMCVCVSENFKSFQANEVIHFSSWFLEIKFTSQLTRSTLFMSVNIFSHLLFMEQCNTIVDEERFFYILNRVWHKWIVLVWQSVNDLSESECPNRKEEWFLFRKCSKKVVQWTIFSHYPQNYFFKTLVRI